MESTRLLIIEPDPELGEAAAEGLSELGFAVHTETDPRKSLERLFDAKSPSPHVIFLDAPPLVDVEWFFDALRDHQRTARIPIIVTVGAAAISAEVVRRSAHCVWKPYTLHALQEATELVLLRLEPARQPTA